MKRISLVILLFVCNIASAQTDGYEIHVIVKPFKNQYVYLGNYSGKQLPIFDSVKLDDKCEGVFKGSQKLGGGIYLIGYPGKNGYFELLIDKQQNFSLIADTSTLLSKGVQFINSPDNVLFSNYQQTMSSKGAQIESGKKKLAQAKNATDSAQLTHQISKLDNEIQQYRETLIKKNSGSILSTLLIAMQEPILPPGLKDPKNKKDSIKAYYYFKEHYWDGVNFWDDRLTRTPSGLFEAKLDKYFDQLVAQHPDSVIKEMDWMLGYASISDEMTKFLLLKFVNRYLVQKYMWEDAVFVHLFEKYFSNKSYPWLTESGKKTIADRAYNLMANITGTEAANIELPDTAGTMQSLYAMKAPYIIVCFWDPLCGHCQETVPKLDSIYKNKWKAKGLKVFAVAKETDSNKKDWMKFIHEHSLQDWTNVYYSKSDEQARVDSGVAGYSQLYDVQSFPTLYLLDKDKRIVAKKLAFDQIDEILQLKTKGL
ncbi:MAG: DUF5106 domain-containing protein [Bacteroidetes bacterium]|nr:DUF5106 domain-containing protein [Bacteroidota bacterium]MBS1932022.1 DUF5106 domain-containing protein [Bacteroidota bacterium]